MREVLYEDELDARARQQRALYLRRTIEEIEKQRLEQEDKRLNKVIVSINWKKLLNRFFFCKIIFYNILNSRRFHNRRHNRKTFSDAKKKKCNII